jgi:hypothetical protein
MKSRYSAPTFLILAATAASLATAPQAAKARSKKARHEVYAATDPSDMPGQVGDMTPAPTDTVPPNSAIVKTQPLQAAPPVPKLKAASVVTPPHPEATPAPRATQEAKFDAVPANQVEPIEERLKIVEEMIQKYGRAYDYRVHTLKELQEIQKSLGSEAAAPRRESPMDAAIDARLELRQTAAVGPRVRTVAPAPGAPAAAKAQQAGQAATTENAENPDLKSLPAPADMDGINADPADDYQ